MKKILVTLFISLATFLQFGCEETYIINEGVSSILITPSQNSVIVNNQISLTITTNSGEDITENAVIRLNGNIIEEPTIELNEIGINEITAQYINLSTSVEIEVTDGSEINFKKRALVEDYTGTWCGWCPRVSHAIDMVAEQTDDVVFVAIHRAPAGTEDPFIYTDADELEAMINTPGYPKGFVNRIHQWQFPEPDNIAQVIGFTQGANPKTGLAINSSVDNGQINLDVKSQYSKDFQNLRLVVYLVENELVYPQVNYTAYYNNANPIANYTHNYTLRKSITPILGQPIAKENTTTGTIHTTTFNIPTPAAISNIDHVDVVAFLVNPDNSVLNVRKASLNSSQDFEILQ